MNHISHSKIAFAASILILTSSFSAFAEVLTQKCSDSPIFTDNACSVCYIEERVPTKTEGGWTADLSDTVIPWEHSGIDLQEIIAENAQKFPEIVASADVVVTPIEADKLWEFNTDIAWYDVGSDREYFIEKWAKKKLYNVKTGTKLVVTGKWDKDTVLIKAPLVYEEYDKDLNQSASGKNRNICVLNSFSFSPVAVPTPKPPVVPDVVVPTTEMVTEIVWPLDAAGPAEEEEVAEMTPEQTETKAGPEFWIFILFAFVLSSAWTAWKKQQRV